MATAVRIPVPDSVDDDTDCPKISGFEVAGSYNWLDEYTPTILVPGIPPVWSPPTISPSLESDSGPRYVDQNTDRNPVSPLAALTRAVRSSQPNFDFTAINIITDRRPIRKLYGFVAGDRNSFDFGVTILGNTTLLTRMEKRTRDERPNPKYAEFRQAFEGAYLKVPVSCKGSTSHHRVVRYVFGGMTFLVRSAVDAYLRDRAEELEPGDGDKQTGSEELTDFVKAWSLDEPQPSFSFTRTASVIVIPGGRQIPHAATVELSTRSKWAQVDLYARKMPDLWISQTANFMEAYHSYNEHNVYSPRASQGNWRVKAQPSKARSQTRLTKFTDIKVKPLKDDLLAWETANAKTLRKLVVVIKEVIEAAKNLRGTCIASYDGNARVLEISQANDGDVPSLPEELKDFFLQPGQEK